MHWTMADPERRRRTAAASPSTARSSKKTAPAMAPQHLVTKTKVMVMNSRDAAPATKGHTVLAPRSKPRNPTFLKMANVPTAMDMMSKHSTTVALTMTAGTGKNPATVKDLVKMAMTAPKAPHHVDRGHYCSASVRKASPAAPPSEMDRKLFSDW